MSTDQERQDVLRQITEDYGNEWLTQFKPGTPGCHELLDRTCLIADLIEQYVLSHPACAQDAEWYSLAAQAVSGLRALYQRVGERHFDDEPGSAKPAGKTSRAPRASKFETGEQALEGLVTSKPKRK